MADRLMSAIVDERNDQLRAATQSAGDLPHSRFADDPPMRRNALAAVGLALCAALFFTMT